MGTQYSVYKGDDFIFMGTLEEVAEFLGVSKKSVSWMTTPAAHKLAEKPGSTKMIVEKIEVDQRR